MSAPLSKRLKVEPNERWPNGKKLWFCPKCRQIYRKQSDAQACCKKLKLNKSNEHWLRDSEPSELPLGIFRILDTPLWYTGEPIYTSKDKRWILENGATAVWIKERMNLEWGLKYFIIPKKLDSEYLNNTALSFCYIEKDFKKWWENENKAGKYGGKYGVESERWYNIFWNRLITWIEEYYEILHSIIPESKVECIIAGLQQYEDFTMDEIIHTLTGVSKLAAHINCADRDIFHCSTLNPGTPMEKYYIYALEKLRQYTETFIQDGDFTDLVGRLGVIIEEERAKWLEL